MTSMILDGGVRKIKDKHTLVIRKDECNERNKQDFVKEDNRLGPDLDGKVKDISQGDIQANISRWISQGKTGNRDFSE